MSATLKLKPAVRSETIEEALLALQSGENCELPVLPEVAVQLLKLTSDVDCNVGDIVSLSGDVGTMNDYIVTMNSDVVTMHGLQ